jgi:hypothetical protein
VTTYVKSPVVVPTIGVTSLVYGKYITSGSGKNKTTVFTETKTFKRGEAVVLRATVTNPPGIPVANATVQMSVTGPASVNLTSGLSNASGIAEAKWTTTVPNKRGQVGTPTGSYTATVTGVTATGYNWDGVGTSVSFTIE